jgi:hypothetical protein
MIETQAYFDNIKAVLLQHLAEAEKSILVAMAWFTEDDLLDELLRCARKGIDIQLVIMDDKINQQSGLDYESLVTEGGKLWFFPDGKATMHHKFCLIDDKVVLTGSFNWTRKASLHNSETLIVMPLTAELAKRFSTEFEKIKSSCQFIDNQVNIVFAAAKIEENTSSEIAVLGESLTLLIQMLQVEVAALEAEKTYWENAITAFERSVRLQLQTVLLQFFELQRRLAEIKAKFSQKFADKATFEEKEKAHHKFKNQLNDDTATEAKTKILDENQALDLKKLYREALFMSHPDRFSGDAEKEAKANEITAALNEAYQQKDLEKVRTIWQSLKDGVAFEIDFATASKERLQAIYLKLLQQKAELLSALDVLKSNEYYDAIARKTDIFTYSENLKIQIELKINILQKEIKEHE